MGFESPEEPDVGFRERLLPHLANPGTIYIFHSPEETIFKRWGPFQALVAERGKGIRVEKVIPDRSGKKICLLMKEAEKAGMSLRTIGRWIRERLDQMAEIIWDESGTLAAS